MTSSSSAAVNHKEKSPFRGSNGAFSSLDVQSSTPCVVQNVKMIEMWICNMLNLPVPIHGKFTLKLLD